MPFKAEQDCTDNRTSDLDNAAGPGGETGIHSGLKSSVWCIYLVLRSVVRNCA
jgi:hypothetical protein